MLRTVQPKWLALTALLLVAAVLAAVRISQLAVSQPAEAVRFFKLHEMQWSPDTGTLTPTGEDPHGFLELPAASVPLTGLVMDFAGEALPGPSYIYPSPAHFPGISTSDATVVAGKMEPISGGFRLHFALPPSGAARFDLPDALHHPVALRRIVFETHFVGSSNALFSLFAGCSAAALAIVFWHFAGPLIARRRAAELAILAILIVAKLWLISGLKLSIFPNAMHDDALFLTQGHSIANGDWLGPFGELTLSKGPTFPIFIALVQLTRVPFLTAETALHAVACLALLLALWPVLPRAGLRLILFAVILFDPHTLSIQVVAQVLRSGIQPALTLFALAGFVGVLLRVRTSAWRALPWAVLAGVGFTFFWYCREEGIWLVPSALLLGGVSLWFAWRAGPRGRGLRLAVVVLPALFWFGGQTALRAVNHAYYGASITIDVKDGGYPAAYAALTRITPAEFIAEVPVLQETRLRAYAVSPAFATLKPFLEGTTGRNWAQLGWEGSTHPRARLEMKGWFQWALRQTAREAGHYKNAATATAFWQQVADEINAACDDGRLAAGPRRSGFFPRWHPSLWAPLRASLGNALGIVAQFSDFNSQPTPSEGDPGRIAFFSRMLHEPAAIGRIPPTAPTHVGLVIYHLYALVGLVATGLAFVAFLVFSLRAARRRDDLARFTLLATFAGGALALVVIVSLVDATSFSAVHAIYLSAAEPLILACWVLGPAWVLEGAVGARIHHWLGSLRTPDWRAIMHDARPSQRGAARTLAALFALLAVISALVRWQQTSTVIPGGRATFAMLHDLRWDPATRRLERTAHDPFVVLDLAPGSMPVRDLEVDFAGDYTNAQGLFYTFQYAASLPGFGLDGDSMQEGTITSRPGGFTAHWTLQDTKVVRLDLPDYLAQPIELREIRLKTSYVWFGSTAFRCLIGCSAAAVLCLIWSLTSGAGPRRGSLVVAAIGVLLCVQLWLAADVPLSVYGSAAHDDALFVGWADAILRGQWLGPFNEITLTKGPVYALFLAVVSWSGLRMEIVQAAFYALACLLFVAALRPVIRSWSVGLLLFAVLLFNPHGFSAEVVGRPLRSGIQPALTLLVLAGAFGLALRLTGPRLAAAGWALGAGVALALFWYCREESVWLLPSLAIAAGLAVIQLARARQLRAWSRWALLALPLVLLFAATWSLRAINRTYYGAAITLDVRDGHFPAAYGALTRIAPTERIPLVPVTKETRLRAYAVSPAFRELQPFLEGPLGAGWSQPGWEGSTHPRARQEIRGWFQWALRQAAAQAGKYRDARTADDYWRQVADEINAACDDGRLAAGPHRSGFLPHLDASLWPDFVAAWLHAYAIAARLQSFTFELSPSEATPAQSALFRRVTHEFPRSGGVSETSARYGRVYLYLTYHYVTLVTPLLTLVTLAFVSWRAVRHRVMLAEAALLLALVGGALVLISLVALVHAAAFPAINGGYLSPATPLLLAASVLAPFWLWQARRRPANTNE